ncbi:hypothetical protein J6590_056810 [Homalodisca vitripennis]|nr:hypothetical protein J6590_056810 [Homalodisca vitripennis]
MTINTHSKGFNVTFGVGFVAFWLDSDFYGGCKVSASVKFRIDRYADEPSHVLFALMFRLLQDMRQRAAQCVATENDKQREYRLKEQRRRDGRHCRALELDNYLPTYK